MVNYYNTEDLAIGLVPLESKNQEFVVSQFIEKFRALVASSQDEENFGGFNFCHIRLKR